LVTHKLKEVLAVTDRVSVMRAGCIVATLDTAATDAERLAELMIGRRLPPQAKRVATVSGNPVLEVEELTGAGLHDVSFSISAGEIVGVAGVAGNGQSELLAAIARMIPAQGSLRIAGHEAASLNADGRRGLGIAHIPRRPPRHGVDRRVHRRRKLYSRRPAQTTFRTRLDCRTRGVDRGGAAVDGRVRCATAG
jgi:ABC-type uncharacterized transport system ATPase subunit